VEGLVCTTDTSEVVAELGCSAATDLRACTSGESKICWQIGGLLGCGRGQNWVVVKAGMGISRLKKWRVQGWKMCRLCGGYR
jgi:hypothetical protein